MHLQQNGERTKNLRLKNIVRSITSTTQHTLSLVSYPTTVAPKACQKCADIWRLCTHISRINLRNFFWKKGRWNGQPTQSTAKHIFPRKITQVGPRGWGPYIIGPRHKKVWERLAYSIAIYCDISYCNPCIVICNVSPDSCWYTALIAVNVYFMYFGLFSKENCTLWVVLPIIHNLYVRQEHRCLSLLCVFSRSLDGRLVMTVLHIQCK